MIERASKHVDSRRDLPVPFVVARTTFFFYWVYKLFSISLNSLLLNSSQLARQPLVDLVFLSSLLFSRMNILKEIFIVSTRIEQTID